jgi:hypothetical protein
VTGEHLPSRCSLARRQRLSSPACRIRPELRESDEARLAHDHPGAEETFESQLSRVVGQCSNDRQLDPAKASPAELLAAYVWAAASGGAAGGGALG